LHPERSAQVELDDRVVGWIGELHPRWQQRYELPSAAVAFEVDAEPLLVVPIPRSVAVSRFPPAIRDLAVVVEEGVPARSLLDALRTARPGLIQEVRLFDLYRGESIGKRRKSLAFRVVMQDTARTLTDAEVDAAMADLMQLLSDRFGAQGRS